MAFDTLIDSLPRSLPSATDEDWRFTPLARLQKASLGQKKPQPQAENAARAIANVKRADCDCLILAQGRAEFEQNSESALTLSHASGKIDLQKFHLGASDAAQKILPAADSYVHLRLADGVKAKKPLHIIHDVATAPPLLRIELGDGAEIEIIENFILPPNSSDMLWHRQASFITLGKDARLRRFTSGLNYRQNSFITRMVFGHLADSAHWDDTDLVLMAGENAPNLSPGFSRYDLKIALAGERSEFTLHAAHLLGDQAHHSLVSKIYHRGKDTRSRQNFRTLAYDQADAVGQALIEVAPTAHKTDAHLLTRGMMIPRGQHDQATNGKLPQILFKPELKIYADDVKCSHGATLGALDADALFYLATRGVPPDEARALLLSAFIRDGLAGLEDFTSPGLMQNAQNEVAAFLQAQDLAHAKGVRAHG